MSKFEEILKEIKNFDPNKNHWDFRDDYKKTFLKAINDFTPEEKERIGEIILATIKTRSSNFADSVYGPIIEKRKLVDWKKKPELIEAIFEAIIEQCEAKDELVYYTSYVEKLMTLLTSGQLFDQHHKTIFAMVLKSFGLCSKPNHSIHPAALNCITKFQWGNYPELVVKATKLLCKVVMENPDTCESEWINTNLTIFLSMAFRGNSAGSVVKINGVAVGSQDAQPVTTIHQMLLDDVTKLVKFCADQDWQFSEDPSKSTICCTVLKGVLEDFLNNGNVPVDIVRPMYATICELRECGEANLERDAGYIVSAMAGNTELNADRIPQLIEEFLQNKIQIGHKIPDMYKSTPDPFYPFLPQFELFLMDSNYPYIYYISQLFVEVAKNKPEKLSDSMCQKMVNLLTHDSAKYATIQFLEALATTNPQLAIKYDQALIKCMNEDDVTVGMVTGALVKMAVDDEKCDLYLNAMAARIKVMTAQSMYVVGVIYNMRLIGMKNPELLKKHLDLLLMLRDSAALKDACQSAIDVIEGRTLENISKEVTDQRKDIVEIDHRLVTNENKVDQLETRVGENEEQLTVLQNDVNDQGQKLNDLEQVVDKTVEKVEELDHKTLSHAPTWSREVAIILNEKHDRDWRLLAFRMGYNAEDIRNWATQPNPCLSLFDEWFATHKTREATYAVLQMLGEMDRQDAAHLVQKALDAVADVVEEEEPEPLHPPPVFLSYQWAHQNEVRLLKKHLEMAGYPCWMDIGQMGGGDKLFQKIDGGMRAAKVVICCVTQTYAESPNCNREVNLAVTLGKPIIPLLMEKMAWPPAGSMGPIFGEYLFVRFYQRPEENLGDDRYWAADFFSQLLVQIRYSVAPDTTTVTEDSPYKTWWKPEEEIIVIKKRNSVAGLAPLKDSDRKESPQPSSPEVFISYQWDKQPQIKSLYKKLCERGYTCWLDILQMGGGDSLYDKIDKGVRGSRVVVSCVTKKYALSANCRREVSLSDAITKPIIPLLLESMSWPPEGPMGMILSPLLYIDFTKSSEDLPWDDTKNFEYLIDKIAHNLKSNASYATTTPLPEIKKDVISAKPTTAPKPVSTTPAPISPIPVSKNILPTAKKPSTKSIGEVPHTAPKLVSKIPKNVNDPQKAAADNNASLISNLRTENSFSVDEEFLAVKKNIRPNTNIPEKKKNKCCLIS